MLKKIDKFFLTCPIPVDLCNVSISISACGKKNHHGHRHTYIQTLINLVIFVFNSTMRICALSWLLASPQPYEPFLLLVGWGGGSLSSIIIFL